MRLLPAARYCDECGLPLFACSALAMYRLAAERYEQGKTEAARDFIKSAQNSYEAFREEQKTGAS